MNDRQPLRALDDHTHVGITTRIHRQNRGRGQTVAATKNQIAGLDRRHALEHHPLRIPLRPIETLLRRLEKDEYGNDAPH